MYKGDLLRRGFRREGRRREENWGQKQLKFIM